MTRQSPPELFAQRPVRSDFGRRRSPSPFTPRKLLAAIGLLILAVLGGMWLNSMGSSEAPENAQAIPNIQAEMPIKQKPEQPGGVDIPHQDVAVFEQLDHRGSAPTSSGAIEQLLPMPETPQEAPAPVQPSVPAEVSAAPAPQAAPTAVVEKPQDETLPPAVTEAEPAAVTEAKPAALDAPQLVAEPKKESVKKEEPKPAQAVKTAALKVEKQAKAKAETPVTSARLPAELFTTGEVPASAVSQTAAATTSGKTAQVQIASYPDEATAQAELKRFSSKYVAILGGVSLRIVSINLGAKGTYHRIVSASVPVEKAKAICMDIAKQKGSCILVK